MHPTTRLASHPRTSTPRRRAVAPTLLGVVLALALLLATPLTASAQDAPAAPSTGASTSAPQTWTLKPATADGPDARAHLVYDVTPGETISDFVSITNFSDAPLHLDVYGGDAFTPEQGGYDLLPRAETSVDVGAWISLRQTAVDLAPRQTVVLPVTIRVPGNATPGDHSGGIVAALVTTATDGSGQQVAVEHRVGTRIYLRVDGEMTPRLDITDLSAPYSGTLNPVGTGSVDVRYTVVNSGNVRLSGTQVVTVTGPFGRELGTLTLPELPELLPGSSIEVAGTVDGVWPAGRITTEVELQPVDPKGAVEVAPVTRSTTQWAAPWGVVAALLIIAGAVLTFWLFARRGAAAAATASAAAGEGAADADEAIAPDEAPTPVAAGPGTAGTDPSSS